MKKHSGSMAPCILAAMFGFGAAGVARAHDIAGADHPHYDRSVKPPELAGAPVWMLAQTTVKGGPAGAPRLSAEAGKPVQAGVFEVFAPQVSVRWDERFLYVEGNGMPAHGMMVGITAWQQQVPIPQNYTGANAWQIPLQPVPAGQPASIKNRFLRGAIALAANGVPIFNPQNNRGEVSADIGELDEWGGHCGRADDYHYHAAPLHLQEAVGKGRPIAYALDGYAIYGLTEPDGSAPKGLDGFNGHTVAGVGYHYHASKKYPFVNGGFHGEVVEKDGQVDPQPRANPVREALQQMRGAKITGFQAGSDGKQRRLSYSVNGRTASVNYTELGGGQWRFEFVGADGAKREEVYSGRGGQGGGGQRPGGSEGMRGGRPPEGGAAERGRGPEPQPQPSSAGGVVVGMDALKKPVAGFVLSSPEVRADGKLPMDYTGDGSGATLPLAWKGAPAGTKSYAVVMDHLAPGGEVKSYWVLWDIPATATGLPKNAKGIGKVGASFKGQAEYEPPHSKGPGEKIYVLTVYALAAPVDPQGAGRGVTREVLLKAIAGRVLGSASMNVSYTRGGDAGAPPPPPPPPSQSQTPPPAPRADAPPRPEGGGGQGPGRAKGGGGGGAGAPGGSLVKATMADTMKAEIYADNWFALYINGRLTVVDPIAFLPHNVVSVDLLPEYPMTIAVIAHDNADPKTGLEYGNHIGDAGFILKFADGTVTDGTWKVKVLEHGPVGSDIANPRVVHTSRPENWFATEFDDSAWDAATVYSEERVKPKQPYYEHDFAGAQFIWSANLDLDNTVLFRKRIEKPGWTSRWNAQPAGPLPAP
jgi:phosphatidylethanolamine-binding protein (PEBP) family uncharacterized protein